MQETAEKNIKILEQEQPTFAEWEAHAVEREFFGRGISVKRFVFELLIIILLSAITYGSLSFFWLKFSRAEVFFAECAREMLAAGNLITPLYHNQPFFDKPIFVYWLIIAMFKVLGVSHFVARVPSIVASLITIFCTGLSASKLFDRRVGLISAVILASSFMYLSFSSLCMSDMLLVMFDTLSLIFVYSGIKHEQKRTLIWFAASISMGLAFLTKGPVGIVLPVVSSFLYMAITKNFYLVKIKHILTGGISIAVVALPWFYAAYAANGTSALIHFFIQENLQRFAGSTYDVHKPIWYTISTFFLGFAPWSILLPGALLWFCKSVYASGKRLTGILRVSDDLHYENNGPKLYPRMSFSLLAGLPVELTAELFLWTWLLVAVGFFCFSRGKCDYYTLPAYPAAAMLVAYYICNCLRKYEALVRGLALFISIFTISFAVFALPQIMQLVPVSKYAASIKLIAERLPDENLKVGVDNELSSWIDEILFQSGNDPVSLTDKAQINDFISQGGPGILFLREDKYNSLSAQEKRQWRILSCDKIAAHSLTPGYFISRQGNIVDPIPLVMASNVQPIK